MRASLSCLLLAACVAAPLPSQLVRVDRVEAGDDCPRGGVAVRTGVDGDGDGALDAEEATSTSFVCDGASGPTGATGDDGVDGTDGAPGGTTLIDVRRVPEAEGCPGAGIVVATGADDDGDGVLDAGEVDATTSVCDGGATLVDVSPLQQGAECPFGGALVSTGEDLDGDGALDPEEATSVVPVCAGALGGLTYVAGDFVVDDQIGLDMLRGVLEISGYLSIEPSVPLDLAPLADLRRVGGGLELRCGGDGCDPTALTSLDEVGSLAIQLPDGVPVVTLPALRRVEGSAVFLQPEAPSAASLELRLPALDEVGDELGLDAAWWWPRDPGVVRAARLPVLRTVGSLVGADARTTALAELDAPALEEAGRVDLRLVDGGTVDLGALAHVSGDVIVEADVGALARLDLGTLHDAGMLQLTGLGVEGTVDLGALTTVKGAVRIERAGLITMDTFAALRSAWWMSLYDLPLLADVTGLWGADLATGGTMDDCPHVCASAFDTLGLHQPNWGRADPAQCP